MRLSAPAARHESKERWGGGFQFLRAQRTGAHDARLDSKRRQNRAGLARGADEALRDLLEVLVILGASLLAGVGYMIAMIAVVVLFTITVLGLRAVRTRLFGPSKRRPSSVAAAGRIRGLMTRMATDTLLLVPAKEPGFSKLGGDPDLPAGMAWPQGRKRPRTFIGQIDLAAFRQHQGPDWLPTEGRLYAFCDEDGWGFADETNVVYSLETPGPPIPAPPGAASRFTERRVAFLVAPSIPSTDWLDADFAELDDEQLDELAGIHDQPFGDELQHRIGGYPSEIQGGRMHVQCELLRRGLDEDAEVTPAVERAAKLWRLLLQIDSDPALGMNWGDSGRLYVFIREKDARAGDFTKTIALSQSH